MPETGDELVHLEAREPTLTRNLREILADYGYGQGQDKSKQQKIDDDISKRINRLVGDQNAEILLSQDNNGGDHILITTPYAENVSAVLIVDANKASGSVNINVTKPYLLDDSLEVEDIIFVDQGSSRAFSYRTILGSNYPIEIHDRLNSQAFGGSKITIPPLGPFKPPREPISRGMWNVYKKVEPIVLFHEARHCQLGRERKIHKAEEAERDAWAYAIKMYRKLKSEGLDLLPELSSNEQIISRIELGLISYDVSRAPKERSDYFSKRTSGVSPKGVNNSLIQAFRVIYAVAQTAIKDPSLVSDTLLYKGRSNMVRVSLAQIVEK